MMPMRLGSSKTLVGI